MTLEILLNEPSLEKFESDHVLYNKHKTILISLDLDSDTYENAIYKLCKALDY